MKHVRNSSALINRHNMAKMGDRSPTEISPKSTSMIRVPDRVFRSGNSSSFKPRQRDLEKEIPQLTKKYEGGIWGYGERKLKSSGLNTTKILLS